MTRWTSTDTLRSRARDETSRNFCIAGTRTLVLGFWFLVVGIGDPRRPATKNQQPIAVTGNQLGAGAVLTGRRRWEQRAIRGGLARLTLAGSDIATRQRRGLAIRVGLALKTLTGPCETDGRCRRRAICIGGTPDASVIVHVADVQVVCVRCTIRVHDALITGPRRCIAYGTSRVGAVRVCNTNRMALTVCSACVLAGAIGIHQTLDAVTILRIASRCGAVAII